MTYRDCNSIRKAFLLTYSFAICACVLFSVPTFLVAQVIPFDREAIKIHDSVKLRSGVRIGGEIIKKGKDEDGRAFVVVKTTTGSTLKLDNRFVDSVHVVDTDDEIYNNKIKIMEDIPEDHWSAVDWCEKQKSGAFRYKDQIEFHLNRIMRLDPNDTRARHRLDYTYLEDQDRWVPETLYWTSLGYRSQGRAWVPTLQGDVDQYSATKNSAMGDRKSRFNTWRGKLRVGKTSKAQLANELFSICDPLAVPMIFEAAKKEKNSEVRGLYVEALGKAPSSGAAQALVFFSVEDSANRDRALDLLLQDHFNPSFVASHLARYFDPNKYPNGILQRAAFNVGEVNDQHSILPLVGVLSTTHVVAPGEDPNRMTSSFNGNGDLQGFSTGGSGKPVKRVYQNQQTLGALSKISGGEDFGYDPVLWKKWYIENYTVTDINVRGDLE